MRLKELLEAPTKTETTATLLAALFMINENRFIALDGNHYHTLEECSRANKLALESEMDDEFVKLVLQNDEPLPNERKETSDKDWVFTPEERNTIRRMLEFHDDPHTMGYVMGRIARNVCERQGYQTGYAICFAEFTGRDEVVETVANLYERMAKQTPVQRGASKDCAMVDVETKDRQTYSMLITADKRAYYAACELLFGPESPLPEEVRARIFINVIELAK